MPRPKTPWRQVCVVLEALCGGATIVEAAACAGVSPRTVDNLIRDHGRMTIRDHVHRKGSLTLDDRVEIRVGIDRGESNAVIGDRIGKSRSCVWNEITNNGGRDGYRPVTAHDRAAQQARRQRPGWTQTRPDVWEEVKGLLFKKWSPQQISQRFAKEHPDDPHWRVSHESIYHAIFVQSKGELRRDLARCLRSGRSGRRSQTRSAQARTDRSPIKDKVLIAERPDDIAGRLVPGHWEGDLIMGRAGKSAVATLVERQTRYGMLIQIDTKETLHVIERLTHAVIGLPDHLKHSITWDQGTELAAHVAFSIATDIDIYFCDPRSPWQRGTNENWNGLVRQYLPKGTDLSRHTQTDLDRIVHEINDRPRQTLDWDTPAERFNQLVATTA